MGLMDILNGMQNGPRGESQPGAGAGSGSMSPMTMALLGLLAYKAVKSFSGASADSGPTAGAAPGGAPAGAAGGGLGDVLGRLVGGASGGAGGGLGGLIGGAAAGSLVSNGLGNLLKEFQDGGFGQAAQSWVSHGPNEEIAPNDLAKALGGDTVDALTRQTGMSRADLLAGLSQHLPDLVDQLTPNGRVPSHGEASRMG
jgi:uncharacterized protein YidB (DUF937 family)